MTRRDVPTIVTVAVLVLLVSASAPAWPQLERDASEEAADAARDRAVEEILKQNERVLEGQQRFTYDPAGRPDPFRSLVEPTARADEELPPGSAGMLVAEVDLVGVIKDDSDGDVAFFMGPDNKGYFLRVGDRVYDGTLIAMDTGSGAVTFRQEVDDPRRIKPYRDVVKRLVTSDEESSK